MVCFPTIPIDDRFLARFAQPRPHLENRFDHLVRNLVAPFHGNIMGMCQTCFKALVGIYIYINRKKMLFSLMRLFHGIYT
jgi:hypothetical protein